MVKSYDLEAGLYYHSASAELIKEKLVKYKGRKVLAVNLMESISPSGNKLQARILVPGYVLSHRKTVKDAAVPVSEVKGVRDPQERIELEQILRQEFKELTIPIIFW